MMIFKVSANMYGTVYLQLNTTSCFLFITSEGVELNSTMSKQSGVDYTSQAKPKVIGVDII